jgi:di/tricarboxylate transporter
MTDGVRRTTQLSAAAILAGATALPWATYKNLRNEHTTTLTAGRAGIVIAAVALLSLVLSLLTWARTSTPSRVAGVVLGCVASALCVGTALNRISTANHLADHASPGSGSQTAYAVGAAAAIVAAVVITIASAQARNDGVRNL